jgi:Asp-tRNA(Asn)/Glu-tRNA(Gln) amidotransferase A subunit family amidase
MAGVAPLYPRFDSLGLLASSLVDIEKVAGLLLGQNALHDSSQSAARDAARDAVHRIAVLDDAALADVQTEVTTGYRHCVALLQALPEVEICEGPKIGWTAMARAAFWEVAHEFAARSAGRMPGYHALQDIEGELARVLAKAVSRPETMLADGRVLIQQSASRLQYCLQEAEAVLTPTCAQSAPFVHEDPVNHIAAFTAPANAAGLPAVAWSQRLTTGRTMSLQLIGRYGDDLKLLQLAARVQRRLDREQRSYPAASPH